MPAWTATAATAAPAPAPAARTHVGGDAARNNAARPKMIVRPGTMNATPPTTAPSGPATIHAHKIASCVDAGPGNRLQAAIASSKSRRLDPPPSAHTELAQERDVRRRSAEADATDAAPLHQHLAQRDPGARCRRVRRRHRGTVPRTEQIHQIYLIDRRSSGVGSIACRPPHSSPRPLTIRPSSSRWSPTRCAGGCCASSCGAIGPCGS